MVPYLVAVGAMAFCGLAVRVLIHVVENLDSHEPHGEKEESRDTARVE
jgi:hypothetical protein